MQTHYTYSHNKPDGTPFYIGKGQGRRAFKKRENTHWQRIVAKYGYEVQILAYWNTHEEALDHEVLLISCFKDMGYELANKTNGGEGCENPSIDTRKKMSLAKIGKTSPRKGVKLTTKQKLKISESGKGKSKKALRKLSFEQVSEIRLLKGVLSYGKIAKLYNVTPTVIGDILTNRSYLED
jgi:alkylated DNA nucleotide flippase Atl1